MTTLADRKSRTYAQSSWLRVLRAYLGVMAVGNLVWEFLQLPFYTIWKTGTAREQAFAAVHCTLGDILIALSTLTIALIAVGESSWPERRFWAVVAIATACGLAYAIFSEWLNVVVRGTWAYSDLMPVIPLVGFNVGLSPVLQWLVLPAVAFTFARRMIAGSINGGSP